MSHPHASGNVPEVVHRMCRIRWTTGCAASGGPLDVCMRWTTGCVHIGWTTGCVHPVGHLMSASALQPHASIRVPTASATSGGPLYSNCLRRESKFLASTRRVTALCMRVCCIVCVCDCVMVIHKPTCK